MSFPEKKYDTIADNDWAKDIKGDPIHIKNAKSGLKGYYCLGCDKEMQAVKFKNPKHHSYFRHNAHNVDKDKTECVIASKIYRERLAEQILHRLKQLKVPALYKYAPKGTNGQPNLIQESKIINAFKVKSQLSFYEDADGNINYGKNLDIENRYLLIRPDVTFFNEKDEPILFIEFVITHKLPPDKKIKLHRLGIDTVQIIIPKLPENEIEESLKSVRKIKWVYNEIEANTNYVFTPEGDTEGILSIDEDQRRLFEESFKCRTAQINNLIRSINLCLRSKSYRRAERDFESEISRIENATREHKARLDDLERECEQEVYSRFEPLIIESETGTSNIKQQARSIEQKSAELETRYFAKRKVIEQAETELSKNIREHSNLGESTERIRGEYREKEFEIDRDTKSEIDSIGGIKDKIEQLPKQFEQLKINSERDFETEKRRIEESRIDVESKINNFGEYSEEQQRKLEVQFEKFGKQSIEKISKRDVTGDTELSKRIEDVLRAGRISSNYNERLETYERYKSYLKIVRGRAWEK